MRFKFLFEYLCVPFILGMMMTAPLQAQQPELSTTEPMHIIGFGDSLMAGYQLDQREGFTAQLQDSLNQLGYNVVVHNAGVSGDTSSGGLARLDWSIPDTAQLVILELGANDALRGITPAITEKNLDQMLARLQERNLPVLLAGMIAPPNMGRDYADQFNPIFAQLATKYQLPLYPFFLDGVTGHPDLQLEDGMHPNAQGVEKMVEGITPFITKILDTKNISLN